MNAIKLPIINYKLLVAAAAVLLFLTPALILAQSVSPTDAMQTANQSYEAGDYQNAIDIYESIVEAGIHNSALYYNLGNAHYKQGNLGQAILNYRRAHYLDPRDGDIRTNLAVARSQTLDKLENESGALTNLVQVAEEWLTLNEAAILALILWVFICGFAIVAIVSRRLRQVSLWAAGILAVFLIVGLLSMANRYYVQLTAPPAVVVANEIDVTSGPGTGQQYLVEFNLHAGAEVRVIDRRPGWRRVSLPGNDFQGWVPAESIGEVIVE